MQSPLAELIVRHRRSVGLSQSELARRCGLSERAIRNIESGATARPRRHTVRAIGAALGLSGDQLARLQVAPPVGRAHRPAPRAALLPGGPALVGRQRELAQLLDLLTGGRHRLISVTGPSGVGKSRLVGAAITRLRAQPGLDIRTLDLTGTGDAALIPERIADVLGAGGVSHLDPLDRIAAELGPARILLVLDGLERTAPIADWLRALLHHCPALTVAVTGQLRLGVPGERELAVPGLTEHTAVNLLLDRSGLVPTAGTKRDITRICRVVGGLPLAIELAAARLRVMTPTELLARLDRQLALLSGGEASAPPRHRSLRAAIQSSVDVVSPAAGELLTLLGAVAAGGRLDDLEQITARLGHAPGGLLDPLAELVEARLVAVSHVDGATRYTLPAAVAELARERLETTPARHRICSAVAHHYLAGTQEDPDNTHAALAWAAAQAPELFSPAVVELVFARYEATGRCGEGQPALALIAHSATDTDTRAYASLRAARLAATRHDLPAAAELVAAAVADLGPDDYTGRTTAHLLAAEVATYRGHLPQAASQLGQALAMARAHDDGYLTGRCLNNLGNLAMQQGLLDQAQSLLAEALPHRRTAGNPIDIGCTLSNLAELALETGHLKPAHDHAAEVVRLVLPLGRRRMAADALTIQALALLDLGHLADAAQATRKAWRLIADSEEDTRIIGGLIGLRRSVVVHAIGQPAPAARILADALPRATRHYERVDIATTLERHASITLPHSPVSAARLLGAAQRRRDSLPRPISAHDLHRITRSRERTVAALGPDHYDHERAHGGWLDNPDLPTLISPALHQPHRDS